MRALAILGTVLIAAMSATADPVHVDGDSLVLARTEPGNLCFDKVKEGSVKVRSTYLPGQDGTVDYVEGEDYTVDYANGSIARTANSRIPDFTTNVLYGQKEFDHNQFPGFSNNGFFVFVDYDAEGGFPLTAPSNQADKLPKTIAKLQAGGPFKIIAYGDSITAGGEATSLELRFQQRFAEALRKRYPKAAIEVENGATGGDATVQGLARLEEKVLTRQPDLVLLGFGMNDHNVNSVPVDTFENNLVSIAEQIKDKTGAEVFLFSAFPPNPDWKFGSHHMEDYAAATQRAAERLNCAYADVFAVWQQVLKRKDLPSLLGNNINHPNDFGHWLYFLALDSVSF